MLRVQVQQDGAVQLRGSSAKPWRTRGLEATTAPRQAEPISKGIDIRGWIHLKTTCDMRQFTRSGVVILPSCLFHIGNTQREQDLLNLPPPQLGTTGLLHCLSQGHAHPTQAPATSSSSGRGLTRLHFFFAQEGFSGWCSCSGPAGAA